MAIKNIPLLVSSSLFVIIMLILANKVRSQADTTSFNYNSFSPNENDLTYQLDAKVPPGSTYLRLTKTDSSNYPASYSVGRVLYSPAVKFWEPGRQATFETTLRFFITKVNNDPADGITFFIAPVNYAFSRKTTGGSLGIFDLTTGKASSVFAIEFDTFYGSDNKEWDPNYRHIGVDINSRVSKNVTSFEDAFLQVVTARINYDSSSKTISVVATYGSRTSSLTYVYDLRTDLPQQVQVGISAATGGSVAVHDLLSWSFYSTLVWEAREVKAIGKNETTNNKPYVM